MPRISDAPSRDRAILTCGSRVEKVVTRGICGLSVALSRVEAEGEKERAGEKERDTWFPFMVAGGILLRFVRLEVE